MIDTFHWNCIKHLQLVFMKQMLKMWCAKSNPISVFVNVWTVNSTNTRLNNTWFRASTILIMIYDPLTQKFICLVWKYWKLRRCVHNFRETGMVMYCSASCPVARYHISCAGLDRAPPEDEDFYCSEECSTDDSYVYGVCQTKIADAQLVQCERGPNCSKWERYH